MGDKQAYVLGGQEHEIVRLDAQAAFYERATVRFPERRAASSPGCECSTSAPVSATSRGCWPNLVGPGGEVVGVDAQPGLLAMAEERTDEAGFENVRFVEGDVRDYRDERRFDAVVGRLILFHLPDAAGALRHHAGGLEPGGLLLAIDFDAVGCRTEPPLELAQTGRGVLRRGLSAARAPTPRSGCGWRRCLRQPASTEVTSFGIQEYIPPGDPIGTALLAGVVRTLAIAEGANLPPELELETLEQRLVEAVQVAGATVVPPTLVGAWGRRGA